MALDIRYKLNIMDIENGIVKFLLTIRAGAIEYLYTLYFDIEKKDITYEEVISNVTNESMVEAINLYEDLYKEIFNTIYDIFFKVA